VKPNFLGIGAVRGGSTWLHEVLKSHPDFYLPSKRKEVQYFTRFYDKGPKFYESFFPEHQILKSGCKWYGEITPGYLRDSMAPERIANLGSVEKLVLTVRNPIDRAFSHYCWHLRVSGTEISFKRFYASSEGKLKSLALDNGMYAKNLKRYLEYFNQDQILILPFEQIVKSPAKIFEQLSSFFQVKNEFRLVNKVNSAIIPKNRKLFGKAHRLAQSLRKHNLDLIPNVIITLGGKKVLSKSVSKSESPVLLPEDREDLACYFKEDVQELEAILGYPLNWPEFHS